MSAQRSPRGSVGASAPQTHHIYTGNVRPISYAELSAIFGDEPIDIHSYYAERIQYVAPTTLERIAAALDSDRIIPVFGGFVAGAFFTVSIAFFWVAMS